MIHQSFKAVPQLPTSRTHLAKFAFPKLPLAQLLLLLAVEEFKMVRSFKQPSHQ
jgi:hypothetical protein